MRTDVPTSRDAPLRMLVADPSPPMQGWLAATLAHATPISPACMVVGDGLDLLYHLAECGRFDLVLTPAVLPGLTGAQVLAMARTAGLYTPFLLTGVVVDRRLRALVARTQPAELVDDPLDAPAIVDAARRLLSAPRRVAGEVAWKRALPAVRVGTWMGEHRGQAGE